MDKFGRRKLLMAGALGMCVSHAIVAGIIGKYDGRFGESPGAGWAGVAFIYVSKISILLLRQPANSEINHKL